MRTMALLLVACGGSDPVDDKPEPCEEVLFYADTDGDGYGDPFAPSASCEVPDGHVENRDDCDDSDDGEYPGKTWYRDVDGDGHGDEASAIESCYQPIGYIADAGDCDDLDSTRYPDALWYVDADTDDYGDPEQAIDSCGDVEGAVPNALDCDDSEWLTHPGANEVCDGIDNDCDEAIDDEDEDIDEFTQVPVFVDEDDDGYGTDELLGRACPDASIGAPVSGDCDDTDPEIFPHRLDFNDEIDSDCDGVTDVYAVSSSEGGWIGPMASIAFGVFVESKDIDDDGLNEVLSSGYNYDGDEEDVGSVMLIPGDLAGDQTEWPEEGRYWLGTEAGGKLGYFGLAFAGDWDGDGVEDLMAGAPNHNENGGYAYIFSSEMEDATMDGALWAAEFPVTDSFWGQSMVGLGDIDDDGLDDVLISARKDSSEGNNRGSISVILGGSDGIGTITIHADSNGDQFGLSVANAGDVDGDGVTDVLVGAPYGDEDPTVSGGGDTLLFSVTDLLAATPVTEDTVVFYGSQQAEYSGTAVAGAGDFDGDGLDDILIGAPNYDITEEGDEGAMYLVLGSNTGWASTALTDAHLRMYGAQYQDKMGRYLGAPGDISGDDLADIFTDSWNWDAEEDNMGLTCGVLGGHAGGSLDLTTEADILILGEGKNDYLGRGIAAAGDTNGDEIGDFWVGASGAGSRGTLYLIQGASGP